VKEVRKSRLDGFVRRQVEGAKGRRKEVER
jgi:hypothetical protein